MKSFFECGELLFRIQHIFYSKAELGNFHSLNRRHCELLYKINGSSDQIYTERTLRLLPDCLYFIPSCCTANDVAVDRSGDVIIAIFDLLECQYENEFFPEIIQLKSVNAYKAQFERMLNIWKKKEHGYYYRSQAVFSEILAAITSERIGKYYESKVCQYINPALDYIEKHLSEQISISQLATLCNISQEYLRQIFKKATGKTPLEYINIRRLTTANELLLAGNGNVSEVAISCGYEDPKYFSRLFSREFGLPPSEVRKKPIG